MSRAWGEAQGAHTRDGLALVRSPGWTRIAGEATSAGQAPHEAIRTIRGPLIGEVQYHSISINSIWYMGSRRHERLPEMPVRPAGSLGALQTPSAESGPDLRDRRSAGHSARIPRLVLGELKRGGFVESRRGARGGYLLLSQPDRLTVGEVIRFVDGPVPPVRCVTEAERVDCPFLRGCAFIGMWRRARDAVNHVFDNTTFQDLHGRGTLRRSELLHLSVARPRPVRWRRSDLEGFPGASGTPADSWMDRNRGKSRMKAVSWSDGELLDELNGLLAGGNAEVVLRRIRASAQRSSRASRIPGASCVDMSRRVAPQLRVVTVDLSAATARPIELIGAIEDRYGLERRDGSGRSADRVERMVERHGGSCLRQRLSKPGVLLPDQEGGAGDQRALETVTYGLTHRDQRGSRRARRRSVEQMAGPS